MSPVIKHLLVSQQRYLSGAASSTGSIPKKEFPYKPILPEQPRKELEQVRSLLKRLIEIIPISEKRSILTKLAELPQEYRHFLYRAVWVNDLFNKKAIPSDPHYGKKQIMDNPFILGRPSESVISPCGTTLLKQFLHSVEQQLSIEQQKETLEIFKEIEVLLKKPYRNNQDIIKLEIIKAFSKLPKNIQSKLEGDICATSYAGRWDVSRARKKFLSDPSIIGRLFHPKSTKGESLFTFHYRNAREVYQDQLKVQSLFTLTRFGRLWPKAKNTRQWEALTKIFPAQMQKLIQTHIAPSKVTSSKVPPLSKSARKGYLYSKRGASYEKGITTFRVYAPNAKAISVVLKKSEQEELRLKMVKGQEGVWEVRTKAAPPGMAYLYHVEDSQGNQKLRVDPFSFSLKQVRNSNQIHSIVVDHDSYVWNDTRWLSERAKQDPLKKPLSIYELQIKSWLKGEGDKPLSYRELALPLITYCKKMGFSHVGFYGLMEHVHESARGYQISNFFAPYRMCGSVEDFKYLVDQMHQNGLGVILDWIPAHYQHRFFASMRNFDGTDLYGSEDANWGTLLLDYSKEETRRLMEASALYWIEELHVDALRVDAVSPIVRRKGKKIPSGISFLQQVNQKIHDTYPGVLKIAEETDGFPKVTRPVKEGGLGFDLKWGIGWSRHSKSYFRTPYDKRFSSSHHKKITDFLKSIKHGEKLILSHSHDDAEKVKDTLFNAVSHLGISDLQKFSDLRNFFAWQILAPSRGHLVHMGDELGQPEPCYPRYNRNKAAVDWQLMQDPKDKLHQDLQRCVSDLEVLYRTKASFWKSGEQGFSRLADGQKDGVVAYRRFSQGAPGLIVLHNFSNHDYENYELHLSTKKPLKQVFSSDDPKYGGRGKISEPKSRIDKAQEKTQTVRISLPPLSTIVLEETP